MRKTIFIALLVAIFASWFIYKSFADYSSEPAANGGLCYAEDWSATEYLVLEQAELGPLPTDNYKYSYAFYGAGADPRSLGAQLLYDFVPVKWEVVGSVNFKSE